MDVNLIINHLGGVSAAARFFETTPAAISFWKKTQKVPKARLLHLKAAKPELFKAVESEESGLKNQHSPALPDIEIKELNTPLAAGIAALPDAG